METNIHTVARENLKLLAQKIDLDLHSAPYQESRRIIKSFTVQYRNGEAGNVERALDFLCTLKRIEIDIEPILKAAADKIVAGYKNITAITAMLLHRVVELSPETFFKPSGFLCSKNQTQSALSIIEALYGKEVRDFTENLVYSISSEQNEQILAQADVKN